MTAHHQAAALFRSGLAIATVCSVTLGATERVHADDHELRTSLSSTNGFQTLRRFETEGTAFVSGGRLELAYGLSDAAEIGLLVGYGYQRGLVYEDGQKELFGAIALGDVSSDTRRLGSALTARYSLRSSHPVRPYAALRGGVSVWSLSSIELVAGDSSVRAFDDEQVVGGYGGADVGVAWRLDNDWQVALAASAEIGDAERYFGLHVEFSYLWLGSR